MLAAGAYSGTVALFAEGNGELLYVMDGHHGGVTQVHTRVQSGCVLGFVVVVIVLDVHRATLWLLSAAGAALGALPVNLQYSLQYWLGNVAGAIFTGRQLSVHWRTVRL